MNEAEPWTILILGFSILIASLIGRIIRGKLKKGFNDKPPSQTTQTP